MLLWHVALNSTHLKKRQKALFNGLLASIFLCLPLFTPTKTQAATFSSIEALPFITDITKDNDGFIWLANEHGLTRYDSTQLTTFSNVSQWKTPFTWISSVSKYQDQFVLSTASQGIFLFDPSNGNTTKLQLPADMLDVRHAKAFNNKVFFRHKNSLYVHNINSQRTQLLKQNLAVSDIITTQNNVYFVADNGLYRLSGNDVSIVVASKINSAVCHSNRLIYSDDKNIYSLNDDFVTIKTPISSPLTHMALANDGNVLSVTEAGDITKFNVGNLSTMSHGFKNIGDHSISQIMHDKSGVLWVNSNKGISRYVETTVNNVEKVFDIANNSNEILSVNNELVIGTFGDGLKTLTPQTWLNPKLNDSLTPRAKYTMTLLQKGQNLIIGTLDGVWQYELGADTVSRLPFDNNKDIIIKLFDSGEKLYIGTNHHGVKVYDWQQQKITQHINKSHGLRTLEVLDVMPLENGDIWLATANSVEFYNAKERRVRQVTVGLTTKVVSLSNAEEKVFAFTQSGGIYVFNLEGDLLTKLADNIGFGFNTLIDGEIWLAAKPGIYRLNPKDLTLSLVLGTEDYNFYSQPILQNDKIYGWHNKGYVEIDYQKNKNFNPEIKISKTTISGKQRLNNDIVNLNSNKEMVTLQLASLDYRSNSNKRFKYRMNGGAWNPILGNEITLAGLSSGTYQVEVMGTNSSGQWSNFVAYADIDVAFPWYWTPQIRVVYLLLFVVIVLVSMRLIILRSKSISSVYKALDEDLKTRGYLANNLERNIKVALRLIQQGDSRNKAIQLLEESVDILATKDIKSEPSHLKGQSLSAGLSYLTEYWKEKYHIKLVTHLSYDLDQLDPIQQQDIYRIIYTAIDSAISETNSMHFTVEAKAFNQKLWLTISDDNEYFKHFDSKVSFNMAMYTIRKVALQYGASINAYQSHDKSSQITLGFSLEPNLS